MTLDHCGSGALRQLENGEMDGTPVRDIIHWCQIEWLVSEWLYFRFQPRLCENSCRAARG